MMKKLIAATLLLVSLNACNANNPNLNSLMLSQPPVSSLSVTNDNKAVTVVDNKTILNKELVIEQLNQSEIKVGAADTFDKQNVYRIEFSNGHAVNAVGFFRMYLRPDGISTIQLVGNFYNNIPVELSLAETKALLKSSTNYQSHAANLDRILGR